MRPSVIVEAKTLGKTTGPPCRSRESSLVLHLCSVGEEDRLRRGCLWALRNGIGRTCGLLVQRWAFPWESIGPVATPDRMRAILRVVSRVGPVALPNAIRLSASLTATWGAAVRCGHLGLLHSRDGNSWTPPELTVRSSSRTSRRAWARTTDSAVRGRLRCRPAPSRLCRR